MHCRTREASMTTDLQALTRLPLTKEIRLPAVKNPAVAHCCDAYAASFYQALDSGASDATAKARARNAYRLVLPPLIGRPNVRNFIACVTQGMLLGAIDPAKASKLLYAAQVANTACRNKRSSNRKKRSYKRTVKKPISAANESLPHESCNS